ncbi:cysteine rich repeat-containing protein [Ancylobacter sonchi]|uniref:cysteine rich repeat-containing protein n=1 Tax=Ancylobacter TaxID=99 RepID=UPI001BD212EA|nr:MULTISPECIES: cysteine rich repeat-containing protein [Ancylobacter]MBS7535632.1 cysteine rich repeat-containing protein [Ancylobacter sonchi]MCB4768134.1 cysteine rich repeat-containing protein [Ancylobacter sp. Lp-2]
MRILLAALALTASIGAVQAQESDLAKYCKADIDRLCQGIQPGGGRLMKCLKAHSKEMSVGCAQALQKMKG